MTRSRLRLSSEGSSKRQEQKAGAGGRRQEQGQEAGAGGIKLARRRQLWIRRVSAYASCGIRQFKALGCRKLGDLTRLA
jgi:hypothetical protein